MKSLKCFEKIFTKLLGGGILFIRPSHIIIRKGQRLRKYFQYIGIYIPFSQEEGPQHAYGSKNFLEFFVRLSSFGTVSNRFEPSNGCRDL